MILHHKFADLPERFRHEQMAAQVPNPSLIAWNGQLGRDLGLELIDEEQLGLVSGASLPEGARPVAAAYAGHQFGNLVPQLGDGRALLLGEAEDSDGNLHDIQLKGSGRTPFSRGGDGLAWLGPVLREYIVSEAMHSLGVPTTRALAACTTGGTVFREAPLPGAIIARTARSHIRAGTFIYFAIRGDVDALHRLVDFSIERLHPDLAGDPNRSEKLLGRVVEAQAKLVAKWMSYGFIHGVMNTDNVAVSGETIDYGPCAFMDDFSASKVFSSIDQLGRYAYANQPRIAHWNLAQLAGAFLPLLSEDENNAVEIAQRAVDPFQETYLAAWRNEFLPKFGLSNWQENDQQLIEDFLQILEDEGLDFTLSFRRLGREPLESQSVNMAKWVERWRQRLATEGKSDQDALALIAKTNPAIIARNHQVQLVIDEALEENYARFHELNEALKTPFDAKWDDHPFSHPPTQDQQIVRTFCGT